MINVDSLNRQKSGLFGKDHYTQGASGQKDNISCQPGKREKGGREFLIQGL